MGHEVSNVKEVPVTGRTGEVARFVHPVAVPVDVFPGLRVLWSEKGFALHIFRDGGSRQAEHGWPEVDEGDQTIDGFPRFGGSVFFPFFGEADQQGDAHSTVQEGPIVSGHARSVIGVKENDRVFRQSVLFQLFEDVANLFVHGGHAVMEPGDGLAHDGRVRVVGGQVYLGRIMDLVGESLD